jgi:hypothetical protein
MLNKIVAMDIAEDCDLCKLLFFSLVTKVSVEFCTLWIMNADFFLCYKNAYRNRDILIYLLQFLVLLDLQFGFSRALYIFLKWGSPGLSIKAMHMVII